MDNHLELKQLLQKEVGCVHRLLEALELEYEALAQNQSDALEEVVRMKQDRIQQLEMISRQREKLYSAVKSTADGENDTEKRSSFNGNQQLSDLWNELVDVAQICHEKNRINGSIVEIVSRQTRHALDILHGILPGNTSDTALYDNTGQTKTFVNKHSLVQV